MEQSQAADFLENKRTLWIVGIVTAALFLATNLPWQLDEYDQAKQAFTSYEMVKEGHWLYQETPNGRVATKPPLVGWVSAGLFTVTRSWGAAWRLPSLLATVAISILLFSAAKTAYGQLSGLIALGAFSFNLLTPRLATLVRTDMPLALVTFALGLQIWDKVRKAKPWTRRDRVVFFLLLTAAMLIKGPIVYAFLLPGIAIFQWRMRKAGGEISAWSGWWPWVVSLLIFLIWVAGGIFLVPDFYDQVVIREFAARFNQTIHRPQPSYYYIPHLLEKFAPWSLLMIALALLVFRFAKVRFIEALKRLSPEVLWLICWCAGGIFVMSVIPSKRVDRIFPIIPPCCLLLAAQVARSKQVENLKERLPRYCALALAMAVLFTCGDTVAKIIKQYHHRGLAVFGRDVRQQAAAEGLHYEIVGRTASGPGKGAQTAAPSKRRRQSTRPKSVATRPRYKDGVLLLYLERTHFISSADGIAAWNSGAIDSLVVPESDWPRLAQELRNVAATPRLAAATNRGVRYIFVVRERG